MIWTVILAVLAALAGVLVLLGGYVMQQAFSKLAKRWFPNWEEWAGRIFIALLALGILMGIGSYLTTRGGGASSLPPAEYAEKLNLIACEFGQSNRGAVAEVGRAQEDFLRDPENPEIFVAAVARYSDGEFARINQALHALDELSKDRPPEKFKADHENYVAVFTAYEVVMREIDRNVPDDTSGLSDAELVEILLPILPALLAAQAAVTQAEFGEEFDKIRSCVGVPPTLPPLPVTPTATGTPESSTPRTPGASTTTTKTAATPPLPDASAAPSKTPTPTKTPTPGLDISGRWQYELEAGYFIFEQDRSLDDGAVLYTYEEICATNKRVEGTGTATVRGNSVSMVGSDLIGDYVLELNVSADETRLSGVRTRDEPPGFPPIDIVLVTGKHPQWKDTVCHLFFGPADRN